MTLSVCLWMLSWWHAVALLDLFAENRWPVRSKNNATTEVMVNQNSEVAGCKNKAVSWKMRGNSSVTMSNPCHITRWHLIHWQYKHTWMQLWAFEVFCHGIWFSFSKLSGLNLSERAVYFPMKAAPSTFTAIINEIDIFNYLFPAFTRLFERTAKEQLLASTGKRRRVIENKEGSICLFERWRVISHQYLCVAYHHRSRFPPGVANTVGHEGMYQYCWSYADRRVVCLVLHTEAEQLVQWPNAIDIKWLCSAVQFSYTEKYCLYKLIFV